MPFMPSADDWESAKGRYSWLGFRRITRCDEFRSLFSVSDGPSDAVNRLHHSLHLCEVDLLDLVAYLVIVLVNAIEEERDWDVEPRVIVMVAPAVHALRIV